MHNYEPRRQTLVRQDQAGLVFKLTRVIAAAVYAWTV